MRQYHVTYHAAEWTRTALIEADSERQAQRILKRELTKRRIRAEVGNAQEVRKCQ